MHTLIQTAHAWVSRRASSEKFTSGADVVTHTRCPVSTLPCVVNESTKSERREVRCCQAKRCSNGSTVL